MPLFYIRLVGSILLTVVVVAGLAWFKHWYDARLTEPWRQKVASLEATMRAQSEVAQEMQRLAATDLARREAEHERAMAEAQERADAGFESLIASRGDFDLELRDAWAAVCPDPVRVPESRVSEVRSAPRVVARAPSRVLADTVPRGSTEGRDGIPRHLADAIDAVERLQVIEVNPMLRALRSCESGSVIKE